MRRTAVAGLIVGLVVAGVGVGAGAAWLVSPSPSGVAVASVSASPVVPASLDEVVAGQGARATSELVPGLGIDYPDTCVGAAQAAAGWQVQVMVPGPTMRTLFDQASSRGEGAQRLLDAISQEVVAPGAEESAQTLAVYRAAANMGAVDEKIWQERNMTGASTMPRLFRMESCDEHSRAAVTIVSEVRLSEESAAAAREWDGDSAPAVLPVFSTMVLVSHEGQWRIESATSSMFGMLDSSTGEDVSGDSGPDSFNAAGLDTPQIREALTPWLESGDMGQGDWAKLADGMGRGTHLYVEAGQ